SMQGWPRALHFSAARRLPPSAALFGCRLHRLSPTMRAISATVTAAFSRSVIRQHSYNKWTYRLRNSDTIQAALRHMLVAERRQLPPALVVFGDQTGPNEKLLRDLGDSACGQPQRRSNDVQPHRSIG